MCVTSKMQTAINYYLSFIVKSVDLDIYRAVLFRLENAMWWKRSNRKAKAEIGPVASTYIQPTIINNGFKF